MDFGIARAKNSHLTQDNNVLGTAHYVSPEQTRGQELGATSDIYSLGVVMYECATGRVPFDGDDAISVALKQVNELPVPPSQINPNVDSTLERIILKCMEKDPANRFQTADELRAVLNGYATGQSVDVAEPTRVIGVMGGVSAGATETRVLSDSTQVMARPANAMGSTAARPNAATHTPSSSSFYEEPEKKNTGKIVGIVIGAIAVAALAFFLVTSLFSGGGEQVLVPNVVNTPRDEAQQVLEDAGFKVKFEDDVFDETIIAGNVVDQTPDGNKTAEEGSTVTLVVSKGPKEPDQVEVPNITDQTEQDALKLLADAKLQGKKVGEEANDAEPGTVIWQGTNTGTMVDEGTEIEYKVSTGPDEQSVPGVLGWSKDDASNELSNAGFEVAFAEDYSNDYAKGKVMGQSPTGTAKKGSTITLTISLGAKEAEKVDVPNVVGKSYSDAVQTLQSKGFNARLADGCPADGTVIEQSHTGKLEPGSTVILTTHDNS